MPTANTRRTNIQLTTEIYKKPHANGDPTGMQLVCFQHNGDGTPFARVFVGMFTCGEFDGHGDGLLRPAEVKAILSSGHTLRIASPLSSETCVLLVSDSQQVTVTMAQLA